MDRREFLQVLAAGAVAGLALDARVPADPARDDALYRVPRFGNVSVPHFTDPHAQLPPVRFREPSVNIGVGGTADRPPYLVGERLLKAFGICADTRDAHAFNGAQGIHAAARRHRRERRHRMIAARGATRASAMLRSAHRSSVRPLRAPLP